MVEEIYVGKIFPSVNGGCFEVTFYEDINNARVRFIDTGYECKTYASHIRTGRVKDKFLPIVAGVGCIGDGKYKSRVNKRCTKGYNCWRNMILRCYDHKHPSYYK